MRPRETLGGRVIRIALLGCLREIISVQMEGEGRAEIRACDVQACPVLRSYRLYRDGFNDVLLVCICMARLDRKAEQMQ
jgi:Lon protease-like protein